MIQARIDQLAAIAEAEGRERGNAAEPFRVTMVGDSTMMQQYGVVCAFLGERPGRRFDPKVRYRLKVRQAQVVASRLLRLGRATATNETRCGEKIASPPPILHWS